MSSEKKKKRIVGYAKFRSALARASRSPALRQSCAHRGQSSVEMIMMVLGLVVVIVTAIEGSIVLNRGMAVKQLAYEGARYAAANPGYSSSTILSFISQAEPSVLSQGTIQVAMSPSTTPRTSGSSVSVSVTFTGPTIALPSIISFTSKISATNTAMSQ